MVENNQKSSNSLINKHNFESKQKYFFNGCNNVFIGHLRAAEK